MMQSSFVVQHCSSFFFALELLIDEDQNPFLMERIT